MKSNSENVKNHFETIFRIFSFKNSDRMKVLAIRANHWETPKIKKNLNSNSPFHSAKVDFNESACPMPRMMRLHS